MNESLFVEISEKRL